MTTIDLTSFQNRLAELQNLSEQFANVESVKFLAGRGGIALAEIKNDLAEATISLEGGHIMRFRPREQEPLLWLSPFAPLSAKKMIRGGIPICWPWFGPHAFDKKKPDHGFARTLLWSVKKIKMMDDGATQMVLELSDNENTWSLWPHTFQLQLTVTIGTQLQLELMTRHTEDKSFIIGEALHSYFYVSDISQVKIHGIKYCPYLDKVDDFKRKLQKGKIIIDNEVDRVYLETSVDCFIDDYGFKRRIHIEKEGSQSTVIWNPWIKKAAQLGDLGYQGYRQMVCVETGNVLDNVVSVEPGTRHILQTTISIESLPS